MGITKARHSIQNCRSIKCYCSHRLGPSILKDVALEIEKSISSCPQLFPMIISKTAISHVESDDRISFAIIYQYEVPFF